MERPEEVSGLGITLSLRGENDDKITPPEACYNIENVGQKAARAFDPDRQTQRGCVETSYGVEGRDRQGGSGAAETGEGDEAQRLGQEAMERIQCARNVIRTRTQKRDYIPAINFRDRIKRYLEAGLQFIADFETAHVRDGTWCHEEWRAIFVRAVNIGRQCDDLVVANSSNFVEHNVSDNRRNQAMFVGDTDYMQESQILHIPARVCLQVRPQEVCDIASGPLFQSFDGSFKVLNLGTMGELNSMVRFATFAYQGAKHHVQSGPEIMDDVADNYRKMLGHGFFDASDPNHIVGIRMCFSDYTAWLTHVESENVSVKLMEMLVGPFNF